MSFLNKSGDPELAVDDKVLGTTVHDEHSYEVKVDGEIIVDTDARGYIDHNIVIDDATNRRLRRLINWR